MDLSCFRVNDLHENHLIQKFIAYGYRNVGDFENSILWFKLSLDCAKKEYFASNPQTPETKQKFAELHFEYYKDLIQTLELAGRPKECIAYSLEALQYLDPHDDVLKKEMERQNIDPFFGRLQYHLRQKADQLTDHFLNDESSFLINTNNNNNNKNDKRNIQSDNNDWLNHTNISDIPITTTMFLLPKLNLFGDISDSSPSFSLKPEPNTSFSTSGGTLNSDDNNKQSFNTIDDFFGDINEEDIVSGAYFERKERQKQQLKVIDNGVNNVTSKLNDLSLNKTETTIKHSLSLESEKETKSEKRNRFDMYALLGFTNLRTYTKEDIHQLALRQQPTAKEPQTLVEQVVWYKTRLGRAYNLTSKPNLAVEVLNVLYLYFHNRLILSPFSLFIH
jgi:hypothetical protein